MLTRLESEKFIQRSCKSYRDHGNGDGNRPVHTGLVKPPEDSLLSIPYLI